MHTIDLKNTNLRTDLVIDEITRTQEISDCSRVVVKTKNTTLEEIEITHELE